jgi:hypothetical protein
MKAMLLLLFFVGQWGSATESKDVGTLQAGALAQYPMASRNLFETMQCLRGKVYPDDVERCGVGAFGTQEDLNRIVACLASTKAIVSKVDSVRKKTDLFRVSLVAICDGQRFLVMFVRRPHGFVVDDLGFLLGKET